MTHLQLCFDYFFPTKPIDNRKTEFFNITEYDLNILLIIWKEVLHQNLSDMMQLQTS
jgi:hypothetical protein